MCSWKLLVCGRNSVVSVVAQHQSGISCCPPSMSYVAPVTAVFVIRWTASAAMSADDTTGRQGRAELRAARIKLVAEDRRGERCVDQPVAIRFTRIGASLQGEVPRQRGKRRP